MAIWTSIADHFALRKMPSPGEPARVAAASLSGTQPGEAAAPGPAGNRPVSTAAGTRGDVTPPAIYTLLHYLVMTLGVVSKFALEAFDKQATLSWVTVVSSAILAALVFPYVFRKVYDPGQANGMQYFLSFQSGFFVQTVLEEVRQAIAWSPPAGP